MKKGGYHLLFLVLGVMGIGVGFTAYQHFYLGLPWKSNSVETVWSLEAKIEFFAKGGEPVKVTLGIPKLDQKYVALNESFVSRNYGVTIRPQAEDRFAIWSLRRAQGKQTLYYRLSVYRQPDHHQEGRRRPVGPSPLYEPEGAESVAMNALLDPIRSQSSDIYTFTSEAIKRLNNRKDSNAKLLLEDNFDLDHIAKTAVKLLSTAHINARVVYGIELEPGRKLEPVVWIASHNESKWIYFHPGTGEEGMPEAIFPWSHAPLLSLEGGTRGKVTFSVQKDNVAALQLAQNIGNKLQSKAMTFSLFSLPINTQQVFQVLLMIPLGAFVVLLLRMFVGLETLGTFMPVLIALAFRETQILWGLILFTMVTTIGLGVRAYLERLKLLLVPRLTVVLTVVVIVMAILSILSHKLDLEHGLSVALFPMVILTMTIERMSILWDERGASESISISAKSLLAAVLAHLVMINQTAGYVVFTFPGVLLVLIGFMLLMGRYRGYRLLELVRFREFLNVGKS